MANSEGLQKIKQKITSDAEKTVKGIMDEAKKEAGKINEANKKQADDHRKRSEDRLKSEINLFINKTMAQARLKSKREYLEKREKLMENIISQALTKFDRKSKQYSQYIESVLEKNLLSLKGDVSIICNKSDVALVKSKIEKMKLQNINKIKIKESLIPGGLVFEDSEGKKINESIESKFERTKQTIRQRVIKTLGVK